MHMGTRQTEKGRRHKEANMETFKGDETQRESEGPNRHEKGLHPTVHKRKLKQLRISKTNKLKELGHMIQNHDKPLTPPPWI